MSAINSTEGGNVQKLSGSQERVLKQVWTYLLQFWGIPVNGGNAFDKSTGNGEAQALSEKRKGKSFLSRFTSSNNNDNESDSDSEGAHSYKPGMMRERLKDIEPEDTKDEFWRMLRLDYPDDLLLRFIRARKWDTNKAVTMIAHSMYWRVKECQVDHILDGGERAAFDNNEGGYIRNLRSQKTVIPCRDKDGRPVVWVRARLHNPKEQSEDEIKKYAILMIEIARLFLTRTADTATIFFDLTGFSLSNMDYAPVKFLITCFEAHYPECLGHLFIHRAPWLFQPIWNIVKNWMDPVVASKVIFTKSNKDLTEYFGEDQLPKYLDGNNDFDFEHYEEPSPSSDVRLQDKGTRDEVMEERHQLIEKFIQTTVRWIETDSKEESRKYLKEKINISAQISKNYSELDPYVRSRSQYDTKGLLKL